MENIRQAMQSPDGQSTALSGVMQRAGAYLTDKPGPARIVSVELHRRGDNYATRQVYVIATGLDMDAPYRVISKRPLVSVQLSAGW